MAKKKSQGLGHFPAPKTQKLGNKKKPKSYSYSKTKTVKYT